MGFVDQSKSKVNNCNALSNYFQQSIENFSSTYILMCDPLDYVIPEKSCCCSSASMEEL